MTYYKTALGLILFTPLSAFAAAAAATTTSLPFLTINATTISPALQTFAILTVLSLAPSILMMASSFTRIIVVLSMLRTALGLQQTPPNSVLISLALFLTVFTMMPIGKAVYNDAFLPYQNHNISADLAIANATKPLSQFMIAQTREKDLALMIELAHDPMPKNASEIKFYQLMPAFLLSELQSAFQIGFMIFLPFLLIDLIVSGILMTMGMMMVPPMSLSLPIKILVFVLIDGWDLVIQALVGSFHL